MWLLENAKNKNRQNKIRNKASRKLLTRSLFVLTVNVSICSWTVGWFEIDSCFLGPPKQKSKYEKYPLHYTLPQFPARGLALAHSSSSRGIGAENQKARPKETDMHDSDWWHANCCIHHCLWILRKTRSRLLHLLPLMNRAKGQGKEVHLHWNRYSWGWRSGSVLQSI